MYTDYSYHDNSKKKLILKILIPIIIIIVLISLIFLFVFGFKKDKEVVVENISFGNISYYLKSGETDYLEVNGIENSNLNSLTWSSSDPSVVSIKDGKIEALSEGQSIITVMNENGIKATCIVIVQDEVIPIESFEFSDLKVELEVGEEYNLDLEIVPDLEEIRENIIWNSTDSEYVSVDSGVVKALKVGSSIITAKTFNKSAFCKIIVVDKKIELEKIEIEEEKIYLDKGDSYSFNVDYYPEDATNKELKWQSSNTNVVLVSDGEIKALNSGVATITAKSSNNLSISCTVIVNESKVVNSISLDKSEINLNVNENYKLNAKILPSDVSDNLTWSSSNTNVCVVDNKGNVTSKNTGDAIITVKSSNGKVATCKVKVEKIERLRNEK